MSNTAAFERIPQDSSRSSAINHTPRILKRLTSALEKILIVIYNTFECMCGLVGRVGVCIEKSPAAAISETTIVPYS